MVLIAKDSSMIPLWCLISNEQLCFRKPSIRKPESLSGANQIQIRSDIHETTTMDGKHGKDSRGWHGTFAYKDSVQMDWEFHIALHGYTDGKENFTLMEATHSPEKGDSTPWDEKKSGKVVWPVKEGALEEYVNSPIAYSHLPKQKWGMGWNLDMCLVHIVVDFHPASVCSFAFDTRIPIGHYTAMLVSREFKWFPWNVYRNIQYKQIWSVLCWDWEWLSPLLHVLICSNYKKISSHC